MQKICLSRETLLRRIKERYFPECLRNAEEAVKNWEAYGGFEVVRGLLLQRIFDPWRFEWKFSTEAFVLNSTIDRYKLIEFLIENGILDRKNLEGKIIDIGCHLGATVDALAMYGGEVVGTDCGRFAYDSPSGIPIAWMEGRQMVQSYSSGYNQPTLVSCFNVGWVEGMSNKGFAFELARDSLVSLKPNGQLLYTFSDKRDIGRYRELTFLPHSQIIQLPDGLDKREKYAFTLRNAKGD